MLGEANNKVQKCYNWLENEIDSEFEEDHFEQKSFSNDGITTESCLQLHLLFTHFKRTMKK